MVSEVTISVEGEMLALLNSLPVPVQVNSVACITVQTVVETPRNLVDACSWRSEHSSARVHVSNLASQVVHAIVGDDRACTGPLKLISTHSCFRGKFLHR